MIKDDAADRRHEWMLFDMKAFKEWGSMDGDDNGAMLSHLKVNLRYALSHELTELQRFYLMAYYVDRKSVPEIALEVGRNRSTVSKGIAASRRKLMNVLQYTHPILLGQEFIPRNHVKMKKPRRRRVCPIDRQSTSTT